MSYVDTLSVLRRTGTREECKSGVLARRKVHLVLKPSESRLVSAGGDESLEFSEQLSCVTEYVEC